MFHIVRLLVLFVLIAPVATPGINVPKSALLGGYEPVFARGLIIDADREDWVQLIGWAEQRFVIAGLELPAARVTVRPGTEYCGGNSGRYVRGKVPEVQLCVDTEPSTTISKLIVLHELAHLWAENRLDGSTRERFLEVRGVEVWIDDEIPPHEWGAEHAAEVVSWGLMDRQVRIIRIYNASPAALTEAFRVLAGIDPLVAVVDMA